MKIYILLVISLIILPIMAAEASKENHIHVHLPTQPLHVHNHLNNNHNIVNSSQASSDSQQTVNQTASTYIIDLAQKSRDTLNSCSGSLLTWCSQNKKKMTLGALGFSYFYIWYKLLRLSYNLSGTAHWSSWQQTMPFEQLLQAPPHELAKNLLVAIQKAYTTSANLNDFITPLVYFIRDVDNELLELKQLIRIHSWLNTLRIAWLFPRQITLVEQAQEKSHRLIYLKNLLLTWVSEHKVAQQVPGL